MSGARSRPLRGCTASGRRRVSALLVCASLAGGCAGPQAIEAAAPEATVSPLISRAERAAARGDYDSAIAAYRDAIELTPWNTRLERALVAAYVGRAEHPVELGAAGLRASEADLRSALEIAPDDPEVRRNLAVILLDRANRETDPQVNAALLDEARGYAPELVDATPRISAAVERRLDLAYELLERGQLEAGLQRLERLHAEHPERADATRLLAQARVRHGSQLSRQQLHARAGASLDAAVALYAGLLPCDGSRCESDELATAHHNRIVAWLSAESPDEARRALADAVRVGLDFPTLRTEVRDLEGATP